MTKQYDSYKPSGVEWLGEIPITWKVQYLNKVIKKSLLGVNAEASEIEDGLPLMKMNNLSRVSINLNKVQYLNKNEVVDSKYVLKENDFLFNTRNSIDLVGKTSIWKNELDKAIFNSNILKIIFENRIYNPFMNYMFNSALILDQLRLIAKGTTSVAAIYFKDLKFLKIWIPNIQEQTAIANYLDEKTASIDGSIETLKGKKELLIEQKKAIIHKAVTQGLDDSVPMKDSGVEWIGVVPEHWNVNRLKTFINVLSSGIDYFNGEKSYLTTKSIGENGIKEIDSSITINDKPSRANMQPRLNSIWIAYMKDTNKMLLVNNTDIVDKYIISTGMFGFIPKNKNISKYFSYLVKGMNFIGQKHMLATGTTQVSVNDGDFKSIYISLPNNEKEQQQIVDFLDKKTSKIDEAIEEVNKQIKLLEEYKKTLINDVVTGKRRVYEGEI